MTKAIPTPAYETHEDGEDPAIMLRLHGCNAADPRTFSLRELKDIATKQAEHGTDPYDVGTHELGLMLGEDEYVELKAYCKRLSPSRPKVRRRRIK